MLVIDLADANRKSRGVNLGNALTRFVDTNVSFRVYGCQKDWKKRRLEGLNVLDSEVSTLGGIFVAQLQKRLIYHLQTGLNFLLGRSHIQPLSDIYFSHQTQVEQLCMINYLKKKKSSVDLEKTAYLALS